MSRPQPPQIKDPIETFDWPDTEIVIGLVCAVGTDYKPIRNCLTDILGDYGYKTNDIQISKLIPRLTDQTFEDAAEIKRIATYMNAGNSVCRESGRKDILALAAAAEINAAREKGKGNPGEGGDICLQEQNLGRFLPSL